MNLKNRVEKLETVAAAVEFPFMLTTFVPARNGKPYGTEKGIQRIHSADRTWLRNDGESEEAFIERAKAEGLKDDDPNPQGMAAVYRRRFTADYGDVD
jgi:hypothetical protein